MKHHWISEDSEVYLSEFEAMEAINFGKVRVSVSVSLLNWICCDSCGALLTPENINEQCPDNPDDD